MEELDPRRYYGSSGFYACRFSSVPTSLILRLVLYLLLPGLFIAVSNNHSYGQTLPSQKVLEAAKKEGEFLWYTTANVRTSQKVITAFGKKYPFIKPKMYRAGSETLLNRMETEFTAGKTFVDVLNINTFLGRVAKEKGRFIRYASASVARYPEKFKDPENYWFPFLSQYLVLGYNPTMISKEEVPKDWDHLLDPKWKGKIGWDTEDSEWYSGLIDYWGVKKAKGFLLALAKQDIHWRRGHTLLAQTLLAGEFPLALVFAHRVDQMKSQGAPIEWVKTTDPILNLLSANYILANAPHPNAAKLFIEFALSKQIQKLIHSLFRSPADPAVASSGSGIDFGKLPIALIRPLTPENSQNRTDEWNRIFNLKR